MSRVWTYCLLATLSAALPVAAAHAGTANPADYPLRVHIFQFNAHSHYYRVGGVISSLDSVDGEGRANLYEDSQPRGFDFSYSCNRRLMVSEGYETYLARWKKPNRELEILLPVLGGKPGQMDSCDLRVTMKQDLAYARHNGQLSEVPAADFKAWMVKYHYDPEHGQDRPVKPAPTSDSAQPAAPATTGSNTQ